METVCTGIFEYMRRKLYYVPGLISIIGLPILLLLMGPEDPIYEYVIKLNLPSDQKDDPELRRFTKEGFLHLTEGKKITSIDMGDMAWDDDKKEYISDRKFHFITQEVERMQFIHDTTTIVKVCLGAENTYGDFVRLINRARLYDVRRYALIDDSFYYIPNPAPPPQQIFEVLPLNDIPHLPEPTKWDLLKRRLDYWFYDASFIVRHNYILTIAFLLLILLPGFIRLLRPRFKKVSEH